MMRCRVAFAAFAASLSQPLVAETPLVTFDPIDDWAVEREAGSCALQRSFADRDGRQVHLEMREFSLDPRIRYTVYSPDVARRYEDIRYRTEPDVTTSAALNAISLTFGDLGRGIRFEGDILRASDRPDDLGELDPAILDARKDEVTGISIVEGFEQSIHLSTGQLTEPLDQLADCFDGLLTEWGLDAAAHHSLSRMAGPVDLSDWAHRFVQRYPLDMLRAGKSASVTARVMIGTQGEIEGCHVPPDIDEGFARPTCDSLLEHGRFEPALDADGNPIRSFWTTTVVYAINS